MQCEQNCIKTEADAIKFASISSQKKCRKLSECWNKCAHVRINNILNVSFVTHICTYACRVDFIHMMLHCQALFLAQAEVSILDYVYIRDRVTRFFADF
jgi:hypothetical protein